VIDNGMAIKIEEWSIRPRRTSKRLQLKRTKAR
jgi:hypothetical protein